MGKFWDPDNMLWEERGRRQQQLHALFDTREHKVLPFYCDGFLAVANTGSETVLLVAAESHVDDENSSASKLCEGCCGAACQEDAFFFYHYRFRQGASPADTRDRQAKKTLTRLASLVETIPGDWDMRTLAFINLNKEGGPHPTTAEHVEEGMNHNFELLRKEIKCIEPTKIIVFGGNAQKVWEKYHKELNPAQVDTYSAPHFSSSRCSNEAFKQRCQCRWLP